MAAIAVSKVAMIDQNVRTVPTDSTWIYRITFASKIFPKHHEDLGMLEIDPDGLRKKKAEWVPDW
jgi:hypothetical protein